MRWAVPEKAEIGDQGFFLLPEEIGFYALGEIISAPEWDGNKWTSYRADIKLLLRLQQNVKLKPLQLKFQTWTDFQHPRVWNRSFIIDNGIYHDFYLYIRNQQDSNGASELHRLIR